MSIENGELTLVMAQGRQLPADGDHSAFEGQLRRIAAAYPHGETRPLLVAYPEMHLFGTPGIPDDQVGAELERHGLDPHAPFLKRMGELAHELDIWLIPGTFCESIPGQSGIHNTAGVWNPQGDMVAAYRKICPWRPYETFVPGTEFTVFDIPDVGRIGLTICYDSWFPEISRQTAWLGADLIVNLVRTTTPDRNLELVMARANAIANQCYIASVNAAGPDGMGKSILIDPEGKVLDYMGDDTERFSAIPIRLARAREVRRDGTLGVGRVWQQFRPDDEPVPLPLYSGRISPSNWAPSCFPESSDQTVVQGKEH